MLRLTPEVKSFPAQICWQSCDWYEALHIEGSHRMKAQGAGVIFKSGIKFLPWVHRTHIGGSAKQGSARVIPVNGRRQRVLSCPVGVSSFLLSWALSFSSINSHSSQGINGISDSQKFLRDTCSYHTHNYSSDNSRVKDGSIGKAFCPSHLSMLLAACMCSQSCLTLLRSHGL